MKSIIKEFKEFVMRGNVIDLAIGIIIGAAFGAIVNSLVNDVIMPPIGLLLGKVDFSSLYWNISGKSYTSLLEAKQAGAAVISYGTFINTLINFLIVAFVLFLVIRVMNQLRRKEETKPVEVTTKECAYCFSTINKKAVRCPYCSSDLKD